jgi:hypothetical protein
LLLLAEGEDRLQLPNNNLDTGGLTGPAAYRLTDETYAKLLGMVTGKPISEPLREDILFYYADLERDFATKKDPKAWQKVLSDLEKLKAQPIAGEPQEIGESTSPGL